jgi:hypothetical protein
VTCSVLLSRCRARVTVPRSVAWTHGEEGQVVRRRQEGLQPRIQGEERGGDASPVPWDSLAFCGLRFGFMGGSDRIFVVSPLPIPKNPVRCSWVKKKPHLVHPFSILLSRRRTGEFLGFAFCIVVKTALAPPFTTTLQIRDRSKRGLFFSCVCFCH